MMWSTYTCFSVPSVACRQLVSIPLRLSYFLLAVPMIPAFLGIIPERRVWGLTRAGVFSMYIYLLHIYLVIPWMAFARNLTGAVYVFGSVLYAFALWSLL